MPKFTTTLLAVPGMSATGIEIPPAIIENLNTGKRPKVTVTIKGHVYRSTVAVMGGKYKVGVASEQREKAGIKAGDKIEVTLELDAAPREVEVPVDLAAALKKAKAREAFDTLSYTHCKEHVRDIEGAKAPETRLRRIDKAVTMALTKRKSSAT